MKPESAAENEYEWVKPQQPQRAPELEYKIESSTDKLSRKAVENPLVPIGCSVTIGALVYGIYCMSTGDSIRSQKMMRLRVGAQMFTIVALVSGIALAGTPASDDK